MKDCRQNKFQTIYEHGLSVQKYFFELRDILVSGEEKSEYRLPEWFLLYKDKLLNLLLDEQSKIILYSTTVESLIVLSMMNREEFISQIMQIRASKSGISAVVIL